MNITKIFQDSKLSQDFTLVSTEKQLKNLTLELTNSTDKLIFTKSGRFYHARKNSSIKDKWSPTKVIFNIEEINTIEKYLEFVKEGENWWSERKSKKEKEARTHFKIKNFTTKWLISEEEYNQIKKEINLGLTYISPEKVNFNSKLLTYEGFISYLDKYKNQLVNPKCINGDNQINLLTIESSLKFEKFMKQVHFKNFKICGYSNFSWSKPKRWISIKFKQSEINKLLK